MGQRRQACRHAAGVVYNGEPHFVNLLNNISGWRQGIGEGSGAPPIEPPPFHGLGYAGCRHRAPTFSLARAMIQCAQRY